MNKPEMTLKYLWVVAVFLATTILHAANPLVPDDPLEIRPLMVGSAVPDIAVKDVKGKKVNLKDVLSGKLTAIIFYRGGWCMYCNTHFGDLRKAELPLKELGIQILAISADKPEKLKSTIKKHKLGYTILSDNRMEAAQAFGIAFRLSDKMLEKYKAYHIDLEDASGENHHILPVPSVYLVDRKGIIQFQYVNPNYKVRLHPDVLIAAAKVLADVKTE